VKYTGNDNTFLIEVKALDGNATPIYATPDKTYH
jgi:hypothetical protein